MLVAYYQYDTKIWVGVDHVSEENHDEVCVDVAFVDLVDDDVGDAAKSGLEFPKKNSDRAKHDWQKQKNSVWIG